MRILIVAVLMIFAGPAQVQAQAAQPKKEGAAKDAKPAARKAKPAAKAAPKAEPAAAAAAEDAGGENPLAASFREFCKEWQGKLAEREVRNASLIKWDQGAGWVQGTYTGFAPDYTCTVDGRGANTIGKIVYLEVKYEKRGATIEEAQKQPPHALETTEVTEIFRFEKGAWVY
ncbi:MAG TPA: hypothetical protein VEB21_05165 [Terriglobales bacterium]|nr:hypothetical protein [Terriglobales bacterium]